jgi:hypothetical protein
MQQLADRHADEVGRLPADVSPGRRGVDDRPVQIAKGDEVVRALDDEPTDGIVDTLSRGRERLRPAARCSAPQVRLLLVAVCTNIGGMASDA